MEQIYCGIFGKPNLGLTVRSHISFRYNSAFGEANRNLLERALVSEEGVLLIVLNNNLSSPYLNHSDQSIMISILIPDSSIGLYDIAGNICITQVCKSENMTINISQLRGGIYILKIKSNAKKFVQKLIFIR